MDCDVEDTENMDNTHHEEEALEKDDWVEQRRRRNKKKKSQSINPDVGSPKPDITSTSRSQIKQQKRLPPLPRDDYKIIIRPRGALKLSNLEIVHLSRAVAEKTQHGSKRTAKAFFQTRVDEVQNIAIVSTPDEDLARNIRDLQSLHILGNEYEITAYIAAPDDSSRGVVHGIPPGTPISELIDNLHAPGYEILTARMLGKTSTALVTFAGKRVPRGVIFEHAMLSCSLYRPTRPVCYVCHEVGHRADVCPNPDTVKCAVCGLSNPAKEHECTPRCVLCKGAHPTGDKRCPERLVRRSPPSPQTSQHQSRRDTFNNDQSRSLSRGPAGAGARHRSSSKRQPAQQQPATMDPSGSGQRHGNGKVSWSARLFPQNNQNKPTQSSSQQTTDINQQLAEIIGQLRELRAENQQLREENRQLKALLITKNSIPSPQTHTQIENETTPQPMSDPCPTPAPAEPVVTTLERTVAGLSEAIMQVQQQMKEIVMQTQQLQQHSTLNEENMKKLWQHMQHTNLKQTTPEPNEDDQGNRKKVKLNVSPEALPLPPDTMDDYE